MGVSGNEAAINIRKNDIAGEITIFGEDEYPFYYRPKLVELIDMDLGISNFTINKIEFYEKNRINLKLNTKIVKIEPGEKYILSAGGEKFFYDRLLIATGAEPLVPELSGNELKGFFALRNFQDFEKVKLYSKNCNNVAVIGGGLLGLEIASRFINAGKNVTVIEKFETLMPRQLDASAGKILQNILEKNGIHFFMGTGVKKLIGNGAVEKIDLDSNVQINAELVICSAGIKSKKEIASEAGINCDRGIITNNFLETSIKDIYAAGDAVSLNGVLYGIWPLAKQQGLVAGQNMSGKSMEYKKAIFTSMLKIKDINLYIAGELSYENAEVYKKEEGNAFYKICAKNGVALGAVIMGDPEAIKIAAKVFSGNLPLEELKKYCNF